MHQKNGFFFIKYVDIEILRYSLCVSFKVKLAALLRLKCTVHIY